MSGEAPGPGPLDRLAAAVAEGCLRLATLLLAAVSVLVLASVLLRYGAGRPIPWAEEASRYLLIWMVLLAAGAALRTREHVRLTTLLDRLPERARLAVEAALSALTTGLCALIAWQSAVMVLERSLRVVSPSLGVSMAWAHAALPVGFAVLALEALALCAADLRRLRAGRA